MDVMEKKDNKESITTLQDSPFICQICCSVVNNPRFLAENYLLDLFRAIGNIDVCSRAEFPRNICDGCINTLEDILSFIDISKFNDAAYGMNTELKKEIVEYADANEDGNLQEYLGATGETEENLSLQASQVCRICFSSASRSLKPFGEKPQLMQLFQNITNIDVMAESNSSKRNRICNKCTDQLERISFISSSLFNDQKQVENAIVINETVKTEVNSGTADIELSTFQELELERNESATENIYIKNELVNIKDENYEIDDIKEESIKSTVAASPKRNYRNGLKDHSQTFSEEMLKEELQLSLPSRNLDDDVGLTTQLGKNPFKCDCCEKSFAYKASLQRHLLSRTGKKPFECDHCGKCFSLKEILQRHLLAHAGTKPFKCDWCEKSFTQKSSLQRHLRSHTGEKPFECDRCEKSFAMKLSLQQHLLSHSGKTGEKPLKCDRCEKSFTWKGTLRRHLLTHVEGKPFKCGDCGKCFTQKWGLQQHVLFHSGKRPFGCDRCEKYFPSRSTLQRHLVSHSGKKPFKCDRCNRSFATVWILQRHTLTHTGEKPFKCDSCGQSYSQKSTLKRHMFTHTGERLPSKHSYVKST